MWTRHLISLLYYSHLRYSMAFFWLIIAWKIFHSDDPFIVESSTQLFKTKSECVKSGLSRFENRDVPCSWAGPLLLVEEINSLQWIQKDLKKK